MAVGPGQLDRACSLLGPGVTAVELATDDAWMRDIGPSFVVDPTGRRRGVDWIFNAWGGLDSGLYAPWDLDDAAAARICELEGVDRYRAPLVLEGGSIDVYGEGTLLTTEQCLLNPNRNPESDPCRDRGPPARPHRRRDHHLAGPRGFWQDETDGHVDNLACFVRPGVVALTWTTIRRRSPVRHLRGCSAPARAGHRRSRAPTRGPPRPPASPPPADRGRGCRDRAHVGDEGAPGRRPTGRQLRELLRGRRRGGRPYVDLNPRRRGRGI